MIKTIAQIISWVSLAVLVIPSLLFLTGRLLSLDHLKMTMLIATVVWFVSVPFWMWKEQEK